MSDELKNEEWESQTKIEEKKIFRNFKKLFDFNPSIHKEEWPGIKEPPHSIT